MSPVEQVASTSRGVSGAGQSRGVVNAGNGTTANMAPPGGSRNAPGPSAQESNGPSAVAPELIAIREGEPLPAGFKLIVREAANPIVPPPTSDILDLTSPPDPETNPSRDGGDEAKARAAAKRNVTRSANKQSNATYIKEVKDSLAGGRPPVINVSEDHTHLKAKWHAAAKEAAYKLLDLRKEGWKAYTPFEKTLVRKEVYKLYTFDPPLDPSVIDRFLCNHLRSARAVWKAHWLRYGDDVPHPNCPEEAWESLIQWWKTPECMEEAAAMAERRSKVQSASKTGRKRLVDRMDDEVRPCTH